MQVYMMPRTYLVVVKKKKAVSVSSRQEVCFVLTFS